MKYYEFNDAEYYALIRAKSVQQAVEHYYEIVTSKVDGEELHPDVITKAEAKKRFLIGVNKESPAEQADLMKLWASNEAPFLLLISSDLC
jgi:hypothetical protein